MLTPLLLSAYGTSTARAGGLGLGLGVLGSYSIHVYTPLTLRVRLYIMQEAVEAGFSSATVSRESLSGVLDL